MGCGHIAWSGNDVYDPDRSGEDGGGCIECTVRDDGIYM
jgi:hypothetical protein